MTEPFSISEGGRELVRWHGEPLSWQMGDTPITLEHDGTDFFFVYHDDNGGTLIIAKRARPGTLHYPRWFCVEPGWKLTETDGKIYIRRPDGEITTH
jgi:hypothetical protein